MPTGNITFIMDRFIDTFLLCLCMINLSETSETFGFVNRPYNRPTLEPETSVKCGIATNITKVDKKIVGGAPTSDQLYPWFAALANRLPTGGYQVICGSTLILPDCIVTAAHCYDGYSPKPPESRYLVVFDLIDQLKDEGKLASVRRVLIHNKFRRDQFPPHHDIAMIFLKTPVTNTPVCLPSYNRQYYNGKEALVMGFGSTQHGEKVVPDQLQEARIEIFSKQKCKESDYRLTLVRNTICAGKSEGGVDACVGDSGGPMLTKEENLAWVLVGITSFGYGCGIKDLPGVYTDITMNGLLAWVKTNMRKRIYYETNPAQQTSSLTFLPPFAFFNAPLYYTPVPYLYSYYGPRTSKNFVRPLVLSNNPHNLNNLFRQTRQARQRTSKQPF